MSGRRAKKERQAQRARPVSLLNAEHLRRSADAVLAVDLSDVPLSRVTQFVVGWCRAAFAQSKVVAVLTEAGMASSAAPARRLQAELVVRLQWLLDLDQKNRASAVDTMLEADRDNATRTLKHLSEMGWDAASDFDVEEMKAFVLGATENGMIRDQAKKFAAAAHATQVKNFGLFGQWREESSYSHATGALAGQYAPAVGNRTLGAGAPPVMDADLEAHRYSSMFVIVLTYNLLVQEGTSEEIAMRLPNAFLGLR